MSRPALVLGGGVIGLSAAVRLAERGWRVTLWSPDAPDAPDATTSAVAAAVWYPYAAAPQERVTAWGEATRRELERLARDEPASGVRVRSALEAWRAPAPVPWWAPAVPSLRPAASDELPAGFTDGYAFEVPVADMSRYLAHLAARAESLGVRLERRRAASLEEALAACPLVVNCAGLAGGALAGDDSVPHPRPGGARGRPGARPRAVRRGAPGRDGRRDPARRRRGLGRHGRPARL